MDPRPDSGATGSARLLTALYRVAIRACYPRSHLDRVGDDMVDCFEDLMAAAGSAGGGSARLRTALRTFLEIPGSAVGAHRAARHTEGVGGMMIETLVQDIRFALRGMVREPGFTLLAVASLGLGVGANTSMFGMIHGSLWAELPVPEPEELVRVNEFRESASQVAPGNYFDLMAASEDVLDGAFLQRMETLALVSDGISQVVHGEIVSAGFFDVLEIEPAIGRFFDVREHGERDSPAVVVLSDHLWRRAFAADPSVVGRTVRLNERPFTVLGVAPASFQGTKFGLSLDFWIPVEAWAAVDGWSDSWRERRAGSSTDMYARLADGVSLEGANVALAALSSRLAEEYPETNAAMTLRATPMTAGQIAPEASGIPTLVGLLAVLGSGLVLLVACGNVASLLLARAVTRRREVGVRMALGAGRRRLVRQLLTESVILAGAGALVGVGIAAWTSRLTGAMLPDIPYRFGLDTSPDLQVVAFAAAVSLAAVLVFGLTPALQASRSDVADVLRGDQAGDARSGGGQLLNGVVVGVVALSFVTLFLAGLFASSLQFVRRSDPGFETTGRTIATLDFGLAGLDAERASQLYAPLLDEMRALPNVTGAALAGAVPMGDFSSTLRVYADDRDYRADENGPNAWYAAASSDWRDVAGVELVAGRWLDDSDVPGGPRPVVINRALAETLWPGEDPIGKSVRLDRATDAEARPVVGVVATGKYMSMVQPNETAIYAALAQAPRTVVVVMAETSGDPSALLEPLREAVRRVDPALAPYDMKTMTEHMRNAYWLYRLGAQVGLTIGLLAALLAAGGLYGIMAFRVGRRRREMGIRIALGAGGGRVLRHVLGGSMRLVLLGLSIGAVLAVASSSVVGSIVFGVEAGGLVQLVVVGLGLTALAALATLAPALAATRADPVQAIKTE